MSSDDTNSNYDTSSGFNLDDMEMNYQNLMNAPNVYQQLYPDEDFTLLIEYEDPINADPLRFKLTSVEHARAKVLRAFIQHLIAIPKLTMPKLWTYRHPGSWYGIRNTVIGNMYMYALYMKICSLVKEAQSSPLFKSLLSGQLDIESPEDLIKVIDSVLLKQVVLSNLEHTSFVLEYFKDESPDCGVYLEIISSLLAKLQ